MKIHIKKILIIIITGDITYNWLHLYFQKTLVKKVNKTYKQHNIY